MSKTQYPEQGVGGEVVQLVENLKTKD
jgi:hypothetical protein